MSKALENNIEAIFSIRKKVENNDITVSEMIAAKGVGDIAELLKKYVARLKVD